MKAWIIGLTLIMLAASGCFLWLLGEWGDVLIGVLLASYALLLARFHWRTYIRLQGGKAVLGISYVDDEWRLMGASKQWQCVDFKGYSALSPFCSILHFVDPHEGFWRNRRVVVLMKDSAGAHDLRRLRVFLKFYRSKLESTTTRPADD
ncbi:MAG: hypothetical protein COB51_10285 [Moraxellaceae bacterium]|nr:MAG: hypothetical protein COB51_10285 [Moraxellaceae bacterium]